MEVAPQPVGQDTLISAPKPQTSVLIRQATHGDHAFIMDSWLRSFGQGRTWVYRGVRGERFYSGHRKVVDGLVKRSLLLAACLEEVPDAVLGWICVEKGCLHYLYVKNKYRKKGVAKQLLRQAQRLLGDIEVCSHQTGQWKRFTPGQKLSFSPGHAYYEPIGEEHGT